VSTLSCVAWSWNLHQATTTIPLRLSQNLKLLVIIKTIVVCSEQTIVIRRAEEDGGMALKAIRFLNLLLAEVLTGNEFGGFVGFPPALYKLPTEAHARAERAITSRFGKIVPPFMTAAIVSFVPVLSLIRDRRSPSFLFTLVGMLCYVAMLALTFAGNIPINRRVLDLDPATVSSEEFIELRRR
jgi:hypothetical protein